MMKPSFKCTFAAILAVGLLSALNGFGAVYPYGWGLNGDFQAAPISTNVLSNVSVINAGYYHSLAVKDGRAWAWGNNTYAQTNVPVSAQSDVSQVAGGLSFSLALKTSGSVVAWGASLIATNIPAAATSGVSAIAAGEWHALALKNGGVVAWGSNSYGQCTVPAALTSGVTAISGGGYYSMALKDGGVQIFGIEATNALAYGIRTIPAAATSGVSAISAGRWHALALKNGGVIAWGACYDGTNSFADATNVPAEAQSGVAAIAAGDLFSVALKTNGTLVIWGDDSKGQTNIPSCASAGVTAIAVGVGHVLAQCPFLPARITGSFLPDAYVNHEYSGSITAVGDPAVHFYTYGVLPDWMTLDETTGVIGGTPATNGLNYFSVIASNTYGKVTNSFQVSVLVYTGPPVFVTTNPLPDGIVGAYYSQNVVISNGGSFSLVTGEGDLPDGLTLSTNGLISGTPTTAQDRFFTVRATNSFGTSNRLYNLSIKAPDGAPVFMTTNPLPSGTVGQAYSLQIAISNYPTGISLLSGTLPQGLGLTLDGMITGTPVQIETANFTLSATNLLGSTNQAYQLDIYGPPVMLTTSPLPDGILGVSYSQQVLATGGASFALAAGTLPGGLTLATNGWVTGTPTNSGAFNFTVMATNAYGYTNRAFDLTVGIQPVFSTTNPLPSGQVGFAYSQQLVASGSPSFSVVAGSLPGGLNLSGSGLLDGTPTTAGPFNFTVQATNAYGWSSRVFDLTIAGSIPPRLTYIRVTNSAVLLAWTNYNPSGSIQVWRSLSLTNTPVVWSNLGVQSSPWTNLAPSNPSYYRLIYVP